MPLVPARIVLIHGAATTAQVWEPVVARLDAYDVVALERPRTGDLHRELAWLAPRVEGSFVVGMSGGATLGLALVMGGTPLTGALLHEPAVGSLLPELLTPMAGAFTDGGTAGFARLLYGPSWTPDMSRGVPESVTAAELAMFRSFEPGPPSPRAGDVVVTTGSRSPDARRAAAAALAAAFGYRTATLPGAGHFIAHDHPDVMATAVGDQLRRSRSGASRREDLRDEPMGQ